MRKNANQLLETFSNKV